MSRPFKLTQLSESKVAAVIVIDDLDNTGYVVEALLSAGINAIELTLRTPIAFSAINFITKRYPEMMVGAGTVLSPDQLERSIQSGALFAISPGLNPEVVKKAQELNFPFAPGICSPSELERAISLQCRIVKFFPAEPSGGLKYLKSLSEPYLHLGVKFFPVGGISFQSISSYLELEMVLCIGTSCIAKRKSIVAQDWSQIKQNAVRVKSLIQKQREDFI